MSINLAISVASERILRYVATILVQVVSSSSLEMVRSHFFGPVPPAASHVVSIGTQTAFFVPPMYKYTHLINMQR